MTESAIEAHGLVREFKKGPRAVDGIDLRVEEGEIYGFLGPNGAGKSTLLRLLLGLVRPDEGGVSVLGVDAARDAAEVRRRLGYMPELDCLPLEMTARDLVVHMAELRGLPRRDAVLRASEVLFQVGLEEVRSRLIRTFSTGRSRSRTRSCRRTLTCSPGSWCLVSRRTRCVSAMAAMIATRRMTAAISNGYT